MFLVGMEQTRCQDSSIPLTPKSASTQKARKTTGKKAGKKDIFGSEMGKGTQKMNSFPQLNLSLYPLSSLSAMPGR